MKQKGLFYTLIIALVLSAIFCLTACDNNKEKYTIAFETNGGSTVESITVNKGDSVNLPNTTKDRYEFEGWFETAEFNGKSVSSPYTPSGNVTLYAKFTETKYNVTFMNGIDVFAIQNIALDSYAMKPEIDPISPPTVEYEYTFVGWYSDEDLMNLYDFDSTPVNKNIILYAKFAQVPRKYIVTFLVEDKLFDKQKVEVGGCVNIPHPTPIKESNSQNMYIFEGWYIDNNFTQPYDFENSTVHNNLTLYAKFTENALLEYTLNGDGKSYTLKKVNDRRVKHVVIPRTYLDKKVTAIGERAFYGCGKLISVTIPETVTSMGNQAFYYCYNLAKCYFMGSIADWCGIKISMVNSTPLYYANELYINDSLITDLVIPDSVTAIEDYAFSNLSTITSVTIPDSVKTIGCNVFKGCSALSTIEIPDSVTTIGTHIFMECSGLKSIKLSNRINAIGSHAFYKCTSLQSITIPDSVTAIGSAAFEGCTSLTGSIRIPDNVKTIGQSAFANCSSLENITLGINVETLENYVFEGCKSLTSIVMPSNNYFNLRFVMMEIFKNCTSLTHIYCEAKSKPVSWDNRWLGNCTAQVHWQDSWTYVDGVPTLK